MSRPLRLQAVAFISPQNHPILVRTFGIGKPDELKYHFERAGANTKLSDCYLGLLYSMDDVAVYGYVTASKLKIVLAFALSDVVYKDADVTAIFKAMHAAYYRSVANPFLKLRSSGDDAASIALAGSSQWTSFRQRVDLVAQAVGVPIQASA